MSVPPFTHPASFILAQYLRFLERIYGMYSDSYAGIGLFAQQIQKMMGRSRDKTVFFLASDDPNAPEAKYNHAIKIGTLIDRNAPDGENQKLLSQSCLIFIYTLWDSVRPIYAQFLDVEQKTIASDIFGDLRHYRNAIIHNDGLLEKEPKVLKFVQVGGAVSLTRVQMESLFAMLFDEVDKLNFQFTTERIGRAFNRNLNPPAAPPPKNSQA